MIDEASSMAKKAVVSDTPRRVRCAISPVARAVLAVLFIASVLSARARAQTAIDEKPSRPADLVILDAKLWTGTTRGANQGREESNATAVAVTRGRIVAIGTGAAIRKLVGPSTRAINADNRRVIPGITDSHIHLVSGGLQLLRLDLRGVTGRDEFVRAVAEEAERNKPGEWVLGGRWTVESWKNPEAPTKSWLDPVTSDVPFFLERMDGHQALVNSAALKAAGIDANGPKDPVGGEIERDPKSGEPTGILKESAMDLVAAHIPEPSAEHRFEALRRAMAHANAHGITSAHDMCHGADLPAFRRALNDNVATVRISAYLYADDWSTAAEGVAATDLKGGIIRLIGLKGYMDGSMGSRTAYMREPYSDAGPNDPYPRGQLTAFGRAISRQLAIALQRGLPGAVHAIGDEANHLVLGAYEEFLAGQGQRAESVRSPIRLRSEHAQHLVVSDIPRFARLGVVASMQPYHKADDGRYAESVIGKERLAGSYAYRQLLDSGALLCFGSDWPVVTLDPFAGIAAAVNARTLDGKVWLPAHSLSTEEALVAYTFSPQRAVGQDRLLGTLEVGKLADLVILESDPFTIPPDRLENVTVACTIVAGKIVYYSTTKDQPATNPQPSERP